LPYREERTGFWGRRRRGPPQCRRDHAAGKRSTHRSTPPSVTGVARPPLVVVRRARLAARPPSDKGAALDPAARGAALSPRPLRFAIPRIAASRPRTSRAVASSAQVHRPRATSWRFPAGTSPGGTGRRALVPRPRHLKVKEPNGSSFPADDPPRHRDQEGRLTRWHFDPPPALKDPSFRPTRACETWFVPYIPYFSFKEEESEKNESKMKRRRQSSFAGEQSRRVVGAPTALPNHRRGHPTPPL